MTFVLEAVRACHGSCLVLHYGPTRDSTAHILIDCGGAGTFEKSLRPRLEQLRGEREDLPLNMVLASRMEADSLGELAVFFDHIESGDLKVIPETLWLNCGDKPNSGFEQKILAIARSQGIEINTPFDPPDLRSDTKAIPQGNGLSIEVLWPHGNAGNVQDAAPIILARKGDQSILISGNATGHRITSALINAGYLDQSEATATEDPFHVNLMAITQSDTRNRLEPGFFRKVTADNYLFTGCGEDGNPDVATLKAIAEARGDDDLNLYFTMTAERTGATTDKEKVLDWVAKDLPQGCVALFRSDASDCYSTAVELPA